MSAIGLCVITQIYPLFCSMFLVYIFLASGKTSVTPDFGRRDILENVVVHLDLKGTAPKLSYLSSLLEYLRRYGANGLLLEYEDMFPFEGELEIISASNAYDRTRLTKFLREAVKQGFELIPLVQTFGYMDYVLKHKEFRNLSECTESTDSICPSKTKTIELINNILKQIVTFHKNVGSLKYFHIGSSDVYYINRCNDCIDREIETTRIYVQHIERVCEYVQSLSGNTKILIWDDIKDGQDVPFPETFGVKPVYTHYKSDIAINEEIVRDYQRNYGSVWTATAFKGADGFSNFFPDLRKRFENHYYLIRSINNLILEERINFEGIILTGLSRHRLTSTFCEILTTSIPSLYLNLLLIQLYKQMYKSYNIIAICNFQKFKQDINNNVLVKLTKELHCKTNDDILINTYFRNCKYPGSEINAAILELQIELNGCDQVGLDFAKDELLRLMTKYYNNFLVTRYISDKTRIFEDQQKQCNVTTTPHS